MTKDVNLLESQSPSKFGQFFDEPLDTPEGDVGRFIGSPGPELIVEDNRPFLPALTPVSDGV
jgi:hypothetical protein